METTIMGYIIGLWVHYYYEKNHEGPYYRLYGMRDSQLYLTAGLLQSTPMSQETGGLQSIPEAPLRVPG